MIRLQGVSRVFKRPGGTEVAALSCVDLEVGEGETLALLGPSGCGKTTTLRLINRLLEPTAGRILVAGEDTAGIDPIRLRRRMGYVVQSGGLFPHLTVYRNLSIVCEVEAWPRLRTSRRADELLHLVGLLPEEFRNRYPAELSGGQRQRVGVARALMLDPEILLMDEPFGALDPITRTRLQEEFRELERLVEKTIVIVTHDLGVAFSVGDRIALLNEGSLVQVGTPADFRSRPATPWVREFINARNAHSTGSCAS